MSDGRKSILFRAYVIYFFVVVFAAVIIFRISYIQFVEGSYWRQQSEQLIYRYEVIEPVRGNIYAEDESLLATSVPIFEVRMDLDSSVIPDSIFNHKVDSLAICLGILFDNSTVNAHALATDLRKARAAGNRGFLIKRNVTYAQLKRMRTFPILKLGRRSGMIVNQKEKREFPFKNLAARTIGFERLAQYKVTLDFGKTILPREKISRYADTLAFCMSQLLRDQTEKQYLDKIVKSYQSKSKNDRIEKMLDELQLEELAGFPIIRDDTAHILSFRQVVKSYNVGLEGYYSRVLRGEKGSILLKKTGGGGWRQVSDEDMIEPRNGCDIHTTIDVNLQDVAENSLRKCLDSNKAVWGCAVLMEVETGYIKAITNLTRCTDGQYREMRNYAAGELIEPGSTFKLASVMAVLEEGSFDTSTLVNTGKVNYPGWGVVVDSHEEGYGRVSLAKAFEKSSNVGISEIVKKAFAKNPKKFQQLLEAMGLTMRTGIDLGGEQYPSIKVTQGDLIGISFGYAIKLSPLQILSYYNAVANNGKMMKPMLVKEVRQTGILLKRFEPVVLKKSICSPLTLSKVKRLLEGVVVRGTATNIKKSVYRIAGKTGTAKIFMQGKYMDKYVASFAGYFPAESPKYSCIVVVYSPAGGEYYGSQIAAPVFKEIADKVYATRMDIHSQPQEFKGNLSVPTVTSGYAEDISTIFRILNFNVIASGISEWVDVNPAGRGVKFTEKRVTDKVMPDVRGMTVRDALYLLESEGLKVNVNTNGKGHVTRQTPLPGEKIKQGQAASIVLSVG